MSHISTLCFNRKGGNVLAHRSLPSRYVSTTQAAAAPVCTGPTTAAFVGTAAAAPHAAPALHPWSSPAPTASASRRPSCSSSPASAVTSATTSTKPRSRRSAGSTETLTSSWTSRLASVQIRPFLFPPANP